MSSVWSFIIHDSILSLTLIRFLWLVSCFFYKVKSKSSHSQCPFVEINYTISVYRVLDHHYGSDPIPNLALVPASINDNVYQFWMLNCYPVPGFLCLWLCNMLLCSYVGCLFLVLSVFFMIDLAMQWCVYW